MNSYEETCRFDKTYIDKDLVEEKLYHIIYQFNQRKVAPLKIY